MRKRGGYSRRVDKDELEQLLSGKKTITGVEITKGEEGAELRVTFEVNGREITLSGSAEVGEAPTFTRPWEAPGWLAAQYAEHGSLRAVAQAYGFTERATKIMQAYALNELGWRIQEGFEMRRWEFIERYFAEPNPGNRPTLESAARPLHISQGHASQWKAAALEGQFFSKSFSLEKLIVLQHQARGEQRVFFPGTDTSPRDFALSRTEGWPDLPAGLLNDLLPRLEGWETKGVRDTPAGLYINLVHREAALAFEIAVIDWEGARGEEIRTLQDIRGLENGLRRFDFVHAFVIGRVNRVLRASAGATYALR